MFFNALKRKGKGDDVIEDDMEAVISTHNGDLPTPRRWWLCRPKLVPKPEVQTLQA